MTREELLNFICPMIEVDGCGKEDGCCEDCNQYLNILLDEYDKEIYNKAIDDLKLALVRSIAIEDMNISKLKEKTCLDY